MRAATVTEYGATPGVAEIPTPKPGRAQVLIKLRAASMNPWTFGSPPARGSRCPNGVTSNGPSPVVMLDDEAPQTLHRVEASEGC